MEPSEQETEQAKLQRQRTLYYKRTFLDTEHGQYVLRDLMRLFHMGQTTQVPGDPHGTSYCNGERNVVLHILGHLGRLEFDQPQQFVQEMANARRDWDSRYRRVDGG